MTTLTFSGVSLGESRRFILVLPFEPKDPPSPDRVVSFTAHDMSYGAIVESVTIGGVSATLAERRDAESDWTARVPSGHRMSVVVAYDRGAPE